MSHPVLHFEIMSERAPELREFYSKAFDWNFGPPMPTGTPGAGDYTTVDTRSQLGNGITGGIGQTENNYPGHLTFYIYAEDIPATLKKIESLGGETLLPPTQVPNTSMTLALFKDPTGNTIGLVNPGEM